MAKKKSATSKMGQFLYVIVLLLGVVSIGLMFAPALTLNGNVLGLSGTTEFTGIQSMFGYAKENINFLMFSFMNLLPYLLLIAAIVLVILKLCKVIKGKFADILVIILFAVAGILFFLNSSMIVLDESFAQAIKLANKVKTTVTFGLAYGSIVAGIVSLVSAIILSVKVALKK